MLSYFKTFGQRVEAEWSRAGFDSIWFPEIAARLLSEMPPVEHVSADDIIEWVARGKEFVPQSNLETQFGEPPVTVYAHSHFYIEALFWITGTTSVHQHSFSGAFSVLAGDSLQSRYHFATRRRVNTQMLIGDIVLDDVRLLKTGAVEAIHAGPHLIHSVFHLSAPSVTIVVRTERDVDSLPQYNYHYPFVALNPFYKDGLFKRRQDVLALVSRVSPDKYVDIAITTVNNADLVTTYAIINHAFSVLHTSPDFGAIVRAAEIRHGDIIDRFVAVAEETKRRISITRCRNEVRDHERRFFLALLLNIPSREWIMRMLRDRYGNDGDAYDQLVSLASNVAQPLLGAEFTALDRRIFASLSRGISIDDTLTLLKSEYGTSELAARRQSIIQYCTRLRQTAFKPVLTEAQPLQTNTSR